MVEGPGPKMWINGGVSSAISKSFYSFTADNSLDPTSPVTSDAVDKLRTIFFIEDTIFVRSSSVSLVAEEG